MNVKRKSRRRIIINFENIENNYELLSKRINNTPEKVFEFEFYSLMFHMLDVLHAFECGARKPLRDWDYNEMLDQAKHFYKTLKGNIKYLESEKKRVRGDNPE